MLDILGGCFRVHLIVDARNLLQVLRLQIRDFQRCLAQFVELGFGLLPVFGALARPFFQQIQFFLDKLKLPLDFIGTADVFLHDYTGLADYIETCPRGEATCTFNGRAIGFELLVRRTLTKRLTGWFSYTLSRVDRDAFYLVSWIRRLSEFDRTHVGNLVLAADLGVGWRAGTRVVAYSGLPYSSISGMVGPPDSRAPLFVRLDARIEKRWSVAGGSLALVLEWLNVFLSKESFGTSCSFDFNGSLTGSPHCQPTQVGPITFPSIGVEGAW